METVFSVKAVSKVYPMGSISVRALHDVTLELEAGELVVLLGASGSGKSTLLNLMGGLDTPTAGTINYRDHRLDSVPERELTRFRREHVGFVFQFYNLIPGLTARENVALVTEIADRPLDPDVALHMVNIGTLADHFPSQMSGGEQQRVAIARAIAKRPDVLLCDEPTGALDFQTGRVVLEVLERVNREFGTLIIVVTHNAVIADMANRVVRMSSGTVVEDRRNVRRSRAQDLTW
ncbi:ABC transporter ATP-binding protein [Paraburkholderia azotifigens]|uniref:ABC transporter ATP-binding protein n=1 Tax=Paraburkholderia azotifigens TaxID=2057004 RepID=A0A5C6VKK1_9BURK|nr:ABC transporter ATP-binding protein [Paraburkholderia azotifigens]TXC84105.1 ABC transporter ATP-binding protein [Paraburkholderia azotifigens]